MGLQMNRTMSVSQLANYIKGVFDDETLLHDVTLVGEVTDISYSDKHTFIALADGAFSVRCVHFFSRDKIEKGDKLALIGSVGFYDKRGTVSFTYKEFRSQGVGDKNIKLAALKQKLFELGYFENRPKLPKYITYVIAVTSADGAAIRDFIRVVHDKNPFVRIGVYPVKVQGTDAAEQMTEAITSLQCSDAQAIVLCRGGGSDEDLDSFNNERLATAVALSRIPVISAVGHEIDYTLCDYCAGTRAGTPSIAGEIVNARASKVAEDIFSALCGIQEQIALRCERNRRNLEKASAATAFAVSARLSDTSAKLGLYVERCAFSAKRRIVRTGSKLNCAAVRLRAAAGLRLAGDGAIVEKLSVRLSALDPHRIIKVGYAAVRCGGKRISAVGQLKAGSDVDLLFFDGAAKASVTCVSEYE